MGKQPSSNSVVLMLRFFVLWCSYKHCHLQGSFFFSKTGGLLRVVSIFLILCAGLKCVAGVHSPDTHARFSSTISLLEAKPSEAAAASSNRRAAVKEAPDAVPVGPPSGAPPAARNLTAAFLSRATVEQRGWIVSAATRQNHRGYDNQDQHIAIFPSFGDPKGTTTANVGLFAVFDGHGPRGDAVSKIAKHVLLLSARERAHTMLTNLSKEPAEAAAHTAQTLDPRNVRAFIFDTYKRVADAVNAYNVKTKSLSQTGGSTFSLVVWDADNEKLYVASAGDSIVLGGYEDRKRVKILSPVHAIDEELEEVRSRHAILDSGLHPVRKTVSEIIPGLAGTVTVHYKRTPHRGEHDAFTDSTSENISDDKALFEEDDDGDEDAEGHVSRQHTRLEDPGLDPNLSLKKSDSPESLRPVQDTGSNTPAERERTAKGTVENDQPEFVVLSYSVTNKLWRGLGSDLYRLDAPLLLNEVNSTYACFYSDTRIGGCQLSRSIGDDNKHHTDQSAAFISVVPEIEEYDLKNSAFEYLLLTSDGFTDPFRLDAINSVYKSHVLDCTPEKMTCLEDPVQYFNEWATSENGFPDGFTTVTTALKSLALKLFKKEVYRVVGMAADISTKAEELVSAAYEKDTTACLTTHDDITVMYIKRKKLN